MPGSLVLKQYCEQRNAMPIVDGQLFLCEKANGRQVWICPPCGCILSAVRSLFCVALKTGPLSQASIILNGAVPMHRDLAIID
eukprot:11488020-Karenia_brevis.AAC.1